MPCVRGARQRVHEQQVVGVEEELPHDREREVAARQLEELHVAELDRLAEERERVGVASRALLRAGEIEQRRRLPDQVERDVAERDVLLEDRRVAAPPGELVAQHEPVVGVAQQVLDERVTDDAGRRARGGRTDVGQRRSGLARGLAHTPRTPRGAL